MNDQNHVHVWPQDPLPGGATVWPRMLGSISGSDPSRYESVTDEFRVHLIVRGHGFWQTDDRQYELGPGDMFVLWPGVHSSYYAAAEDPWHVLWLYLWGSGSSEWVQTCGFRQNQPVLQPREIDRAARLMQRIMKLYAARKPLSACSIVGLLYELAAAVTVERETPPAGSQAEWLVQQAVIMIDRMLGTAINVDDLAGHLGVDRTTLFRAFRKRLGKTPIQYLTGARMKKARKLLMDTELNIASVAHAAGYSNSKYFFRRFRELSGMTPAQFRRRHS